MVSELAMAIDIGGGSVKLALADAAANELATGTVEGVPDLGRDALLAAIGSSAIGLAATARQRGRLAGVAIGVPGHLSADRRASLNSNVPALDGIDLAGHFGALLGCAVRLENDANLAALGEWSFGPRAAASRFMMVTLGTGIGVALIESGRPVGVVGGTLGDSGHVIVDPAGERFCRLGCRGCLESMASGVALIEEAQRLSGEQPDTALGRLARSGRDIAGADLAALGAAGDQAVLALLSRTGRWLGLGLASYVNIFAPQVICIGGGMSRLRPYFEEPMIEAMHEGRIKNRPAPESIYFSGDYDRAAARGAVAMFLLRGEGDVG